MLRKLSEQNGQKSVGNLGAAVSGISLAPKRLQQQNNNNDDDELISIKQNIAKQDDEIRTLRESIMQLDSTLRETMNEVNKLTSMMQHVVQLVSKSVPLADTEHTPDNIRCVTTNTVSTSDPIPIRRRNSTVDNKENIPPTNDKNCREGQQLRKQSSSDRLILDKLMAKAEKDDEFKNRLVRVYMESAEDNSLAVAAIDYRSKNDCLRESQNNSCSSRRHAHAMTTTRRSIKIQHEDEVYHCGSASSPVRASAAFSMRVRKFVTEQDQYRRQSQRNLPQVREYADNMDPLDCRDDDDDDEDEDETTDDDERCGRNCRQHIHHRHAIPSHHNRCTTGASYRT